MARRIEERKRRKRDGSSPYNSWLRERGYKQDPFERIVEKRQIGANNTRNRLKEVVREALAEGVLSTLTEKERKVVVLVGIQGYSFLSASKQAKCSLSSSYQTFKKAGKKIKKFIEKEGLLDG